MAIASLAFHPTAQLLLIATNNELHFWDWSRPEPFAAVKTGSDAERVRWVPPSARGVGGKGVDECRLAIRWFDTWAWLGLGS